MNGREILVFDVNETLLDLSVLGPRFADILPVELMSLWFSRMLHNSLVANVTDRYQPFDRQGIDALMVTANSNGVELSEAQASEFVAQMRALPPHPDVVPALERLSNAGYRLATLTNSSATVVKDQMRNADLDRFFERLISVDEVRQFKPGPATYRHAAQRLGVPIGRLRLVAAHAWDVTGAIRAGARGAFVARGKTVAGPLFETPDVSGPDLLSVAEALVAL